MELSIVEQYIIKQLRWGRFEKAREAIMLWEYEEKELTKAIEAQKEQDITEEEIS